MYVIEKIGIEKKLSMMRLEEPIISFSIEEFEYYADLFEEMLERMEKQEARMKENEIQGNQGKLELSNQLDEFDQAEIASMRAQFGLIQETWKFL